MKIKDKRMAGEMMGRARISERIIAIAAEIKSGSYKEAINLGARIAVLVETASYDDYWHGKAMQGKNAEEGVLCGIFDKSVDLELLGSKVRI